MKQRQPQIHKFFNQITIDYEGDHIVFVVDDRGLFLAYMRLENAMGYVGVTPIANNGRIGGYVILVQHAPNHLVKYAIDLLADDVRIEWLEQTSSGNREQTFTIPV